MRTLSFIIGARWYQFDCVAAEDGKVAKVLLPGGQVPGIVGIAFGPVTELMSAQRVLGGGSHVQFLGQRHTPAPHLKFAQQSADPEQPSPCVIADDEDRRTALPAPDAHPIALRSTDRVNRPQLPGVSG